MTTAEARERLTAARVARLATAGEDGVPHVVPVCFALDGDRAWIAVDHKPKATTDLKRLRNVTANPAVALLADHYDDMDWSRLWWVRADAAARVLSADDGAAGIDLLVERYPQYREHRPAGPVLELTIQRLSGWAARP